MDTATLLEVIAMLDAQIKSEMDYLRSAEAEHLSFEDKFAIRASITTLQNFSYHLQDYIEGQISAMETTQGM